MSLSIKTDLSPKAYQRAVNFLKNVDADWASHIAATGPCLHEAKPAREPYEALIRAIAYQQIQMKAADTVLARFLALTPEETFPSPQQLLATDSALQRSCGFPISKVLSIRGVAQAVLDGVIPSRAEALHMSDEALIKCLTTLKGIGRWTVEMFLIYTLERSDVLPADDLGVREGYRRLKGLDTAPSARRMREIGQAWAPYRTVAAWYLWRVPKDQKVSSHTLSEASPAEIVEAECKSNKRADLIAQACRLIETVPNPPSLQELADQYGLSSSHFHRIFQAETGLTPKAYASAVRAQRLREELVTADNSVTDAIYEAGFNSNSRFYETSTQLLGMRAREYRAGGLGTVIRFAVGQCSLGAILVAQSQRGICAIMLGDDPEALAHNLQDQFPKAQIIGGDAAFEQLIAQVVDFIEMPSIGLNLPLDVRGTAFQERVWQALREIPSGTTVSYSDIAASIGAPKAVRAVAQACGANRLAVAIPCHRVVRRDGDISGYRWGVERKRELLRRESC